MTLRDDAVEAMKRKMVRVFECRWEALTPIQQEMARTRAIAALDALLALLAERGFAVVPVDPKPEMLGAWYRVKNGHHFDDEPAPTDTSDYAAYRAMLAARPRVLEGEE